jgi:hypothetical protein
MADDLWAQFVPGAAKPAAPAPASPPAEADPWAQYVPGAASTAAPSTPAVSAPAPGSDIASRFGRWLVGAGDPQTVLQPRSLSQAGSDVADFGRVAANTFGVGDRLIAQGRSTLPMMYPGLFGQDASVVQPGGAYDPATQGQRATADLAQERAKTAAASADIGPAASLAANMVGYGPFAELGIAGRTANALGKGAPIFRGVMGNVAEGTAAGGAAAAGHDDSIPLGMAAGGATGLAVSPVAGIANWALRKTDPIGQALGVLSTPANVVKSTGAAKDAAYSGASQYKFDPNDVNSAYYAAHSSLDPSQVLDLSPGMNAKVQQHLNANQTASSVSANTIDGLGRGLQGSVSTDADSVLAAKIKQGLDGVMGAAAPKSGQSVGDALIQVNKARAAAQQDIMAQGLQDASADLKNQFISPGPWARTQSQFYKPGSDAYDALSGIVRGSGQGGLSSYAAERAMGPAAEAVGGAIGGAPGAITAEAGMQLARPVLTGWTHMMQRGALQRQLADAYPALTGRWRSYSPDVGSLLKAATLGSQAGAGY